MNIREGFASNPLGIVDPMGLWGHLIHYTKTRVWAQQLGFPYNAARAVAQADNQVDYGRTSPIYGDQSYHFNRNVSGGPDTRLEHVDAHYERAEYYCSGWIDLPESAAHHLGTALHPLQDWVAHGDYGMREYGRIVTHHNSQSPQTEFGTPGYYPDKALLDARGGPDGRPTKAVIIDSMPGRIVGTPGGFIEAQYYDFAYYEPGTKRLALTRRLTKEKLEEFALYVWAFGGCRCRVFFLGNAHKY